MELTIEALPRLKLGDGGRGSIHLPLLECLSVDNVALLTVLGTPSPQRLKVDFNYDKSPADPAVGGIAAFLRRWEIKLGTLVLARGHAAVIREILLLTPKLHRLVLLRISDIADVFKWLTGTRTEELPFRSLKTLCAYSRSRGRFGGTARHDCLSKPSG